MLLSGTTLAVTVSETRGRVGRAAFPELPPRRRPLAAPLCEPVSVHLTSESAGSHASGEAAPGHRRWRPCARASLGSGRAPLYVLVSPGGQRFLTSPPARRRTSQGPWQRSLGTVVASGLLPALRWGPAGQPAFPTWKQNLVTPRAATRTCAGSSGVCAGVHGAAPSRACVLVAVGIPGPRPRGPRARLSVGSGSSWVRVAAHLAAEAPTTLLSGKPPGERPGGHACPRGRRDGRVDRGPGSLGVGSRAGTRV